MSTDDMTGTLLAFLESMPDAVRLRRGGVVSEVRLAQAVWSLDCLDGISDSVAIEELIAMAGSSLPEPIRQLKVVGFTGDPSALVEYCAKAYADAAGDTLRRPAQRASARLVLQALTRAIETERIRLVPS